MPLNGRFYEPNSPRQRDNLKREADHSNSKYDHTLEINNEGNYIKI